MLRLHGIVGDRQDRTLHRKLHHLEHHDAIEFLFVAEPDLGRRRLRAVTDRGTECAISLERDNTLFDGAVLLIDDSRAIVVKAGAPTELRLRPRDLDGAVRIGFMAGHLHWRVRFDGSDLCVVVDGALSDYTARIAPFLDDGSVMVVVDAS